MISVIIPAWNALRWLPETLGSVMSQKGARFEVVLVDDGSTDNTADYVAREWPQVRLVRSENRGVSHARNLGTAEAQGELVKYLDADDLLLPGTLARQESLMSANPGSDVVYGNWQWLKEQADGRFELGEKVLRRIEDAHADPELAFLSDFWCPTGAYLYKRSFLQNILPWKEWLPIIQDARFAWDAAAAGARWMHDEEISVLYRHHRKGSVSTRNAEAFLRDCLTNVADIQTLWAADQLGLESARAGSVAQTLAALARKLAPLNEELFQESLKRLEMVSPGYQPSTPLGLAVLSKLLGYHRAVRVAAVLDRLKKPSAFVVP